MSFSNPNEIGQRQSLIEGWQRQALAFYDSLGEVHYAATFHGRALSAVRLYAATYDGGRPVEVDSGPAAEAMQRLGDLSDLQRRYGELMFIVGEAYLMVSLVDGRERWEVVSPLEVAIRGDAIIRMPSQSSSRIQYRKATSQELSDGEAQVWRMWRSHPAWSGEADSPMRAVLDLCEELVLLSRAVRARARSRAAGAGLLLIPDESSLAPPTTSGDEDPNSDPFLQDLIEAMTTPLSDDEVASSVVPMLIRTRGEDIERWRHMTLSPDRDAGYPEIELRSEVIRRFAQGIDLPPEIVMGTADANHWTAWQINESTWRSHIEPVAKQFCEDLTKIYLEPLVGPGYRIMYDASAVVTRPDRSRYARDLHDRLAISDSALREASGFTDHDAPDEQETTRRIGIMLGESVLATGVDVDVDRGKSPPRVRVRSGSQDLSPPSQGEIRMAAAVALNRAREIAGARLINRAKLQGRFNDTPASMIAARLGPEEVARLGLTAPDLVSGAMGPFLDALAAHGVARAERMALAERIERFAAETLFQSAPSLDGIGGEP